VDPFTENFLTAALVEPKPSEAYEGNSSQNIV
jgi:hypothetical protein